MEMKTTKKIIKKKEISEISLSPKHEICAMRTTDGNNGAFSPYFEGANNAYCHNSNIPMPISSVITPSFSSTRNSINITNKPNGGKIKRKKIMAQRGTNSVKEKKKRLLKSPYFLETTNTTTTKSKNNFSCFDTIQKMGPFMLVATDRHKLLPKCSPLIPNRNGGERNQNSIKKNEGNRSNSTSSIKGNNHCSNKRRKTLEVKGTTRNNRILCLFCAPIVKDVVNQFDDCPIFREKFDKEMLLFQRQQTSVPYNLGIFPVRSNIFTGPGEVDVSDSFYDISSSFESRWNLHQPRKLQSTRKKRLFPSHRTSSQVESRGKPLLPCWELISMMIQRSVRHLCTYRCYFHAHSPFREWCSLHDYIANYDQQHRHNDTMLAATKKTSEGDACNNSTPGKLKIKIRVYSFLPPFV